MDDKSELQTENYHLVAESTQLKSENTHLTSEKQQLVAENLSLEADLQELRQELQRAHELLEKKPHLQVRVRYITRSGS